MFTDAIPPLSVAAKGVNCEIALHLNTRLHST
ncbi:hypothetical protein ALO43_200010 [Pseudomonas tremae]|uniref:Uncharacterized protein n=1 Tax=Pseudomonas tremae TaxID=200454 RepID=A0AA40TVF3_9PSED|nr:hypothetical protein ALO43_200010 [Pseudomonas tremae]